MLQFEYFYNNWLDVSNLVNDDPNITVDLNKNFFESLCFDTDSLKTYRINAVHKLLPMLGSKPALCFSGGIDSQATWQCFNEAGIDIDVYTLIFKNELNKQDSDHAIFFADKNNIKLNIIEIDIMNFLSRENADYGKKYKSLSPHFNTHYKLCDILISKGYTGFVCGGGSPLLSNNVSTWASNYNQNFLNYINYSEISGVLCQGNFLGFDPYLAWAISLQTPSFINELFGKELTQEDRHSLEYQRYLEKIQGYTRSGFNLIPQDKKYTGFELVKVELEKRYGDGWAFEKKFRYPLLTFNKNYPIKIKFDDSVIETIFDLNREKSTTGDIASTGI